jgi:hypothetical protein
MIARPDFQGIHYSKKISVKIQPYRAKEANVRNENSLLLAAAPAGKPKLLVFDPFQGMMVDASAPRPKFS